MAAISYTGGKKLQSALADLKSRLGKAQTLEVGFMEGATYPDGTSVPMVAAIQNFGAPAAGIPPRPFFSNMVREKSPQWGDDLAALLKASKYDANQAMNLMGEHIASELQDSINDTNSPPLAKATVDAKGFSKPLIDTGHMKNSVQYAVDGDVKK